MTMIRLTTIAILIFLHQGVTFSQYSSEMGINYIVMNEGLVLPNKEDPNNFQDKIFHSFGLSARTELGPKIYLRSGVVFRTFGTRFDLEETTILNPDGTGEFFEVVLKAKAIDIPLTVGYYFLDKEKWRIGLAVGISNSFVLEQTEESRGQEMDVEAYKNYHISLRANLDIGIKVNEQIIINILPGLQRQMNANFSGYKQRGYGCELGVSYKII